LNTAAEEDRYLVFLTGSSGAKPEIEIVAHGASGAQVSLSLRNKTTLKDPIAIAPLADDKKNQTNVVAISPLGDYAVIVQGRDQAAAGILDTATRTIVKTIPLGNQPTSVAITPDGKTALVFGTQNVTLIDIPGKTIRKVIGRGGAGYPGWPGTKASIVVTPNGNLALLADGQWFSSIDLRTDSLTTKAVHLDCTYTLAVTPDGQTAVAGTRGMHYPCENEIWFIQLNRPLRPDSKIRGDNAQHIAISPDGKLALVCVGAGTQLIDMPGRKHVKYLSGSEHATFISNRIALLGSAGDLSLLDLTTHAATPARVGVPAETGIVVSRNAPLAVLTGFGSKAGPPRAHMI
jgi:DNA-binding beta-propeller fold protein YncE